MSDHGIMKLNQACILILITEIRACKVRPSSHDFCDGMNTMPHPYKIDLIVNRLDLAIFDGTMHI